MPSWPRAMLFDWDGTLVDSAELSYRCYRRVFEDFGIGFERADYERSYSPDWYRTYRAVGLPESHWPAADARWLEHYESASPSLLAGAEETLRGLAGDGVRLGIVSSGDGRRVRRELESFALAALFEVVVCGGDTPNRKPHPEPLLVALVRLGVPPAQAVYVGDSPEDVEMARAAAVFSVGIPGGFPNRSTLLASRPDLLLERLPALAALAGRPAGP